MGSSLEQDRTAQSDEEKALVVEPGKLHVKGVDMAHAFHPGNAIGLVVDPLDVLVRLCNDEVI